MSKLKDKKTINRDYLSMLEQVLSRAAHDVPLPRISSAAHLQYLSSLIAL
jgi:hypothetical protein